MSKTKIYEKNLWYTILRPYVDWCTKQSYSQYEVRGKENIPTDGAVIIAPNHCNTLMDALVILRAFKDESVFGARADMFNKPIIAKAMFFFRILPMVRQRDGLRNVLKNYETMDTIIEILENDVRFCMYPEGRHRPAHSLLPFGKGIFRTALSANAKFGNKKPIYIVPTGIEYGDYFRYRSTCLVTFGKPLNVTEFIKTLDVETEVQMMEPLKKELQKRMSELITYIPDGEDYSKKWALTRILARDCAKEGSLTDRMEHNRHVISQISKACEKNPDQMEEILNDALAFDKERKKKGFSIWSFGRRNNFGRIIGKGLIAALGLPYFLFAALASLPMWLTFELLRGKLRDRAFHNTAGFGIRLSLGTILFTTWIILAFCLTPWLVATLLTILILPSYAFFYDYTEFMRTYISDIRLSSDRKLSGFFNDIRDRFTRI